MRYCVKIEVDNDSIPIDKNRMILSFIKHFLQLSDNDFYRELYNQSNTNRKKFTFSLYLKNSKFKRNIILLPNKIMCLYLSTSDMLFGIEFYNAMITGKGKKYEYKGITMVIKDISTIPEKLISNEEAIFKTLSPIVIREHSEDKTWYYDINDEVGKKFFIQNLKYQLLDELKESKYDIEDIDIKIITNKKVLVNYYGIYVQSNLCVFKMSAKKNILTHLYTSGIGSLKSAGFGMLDLV